MAVTAKRLAAVLQATPKEIIPKDRSGSRELRGAERDACIREHMEWLQDGGRYESELDTAGAPIAAFLALKRTQRQAISTASLRKLAGKPNPQWVCSENQLRVLKQNCAVWTSCTFDTPCGKCNRCRGLSSHRGNGYRPRQGPTRNPT
jgi:hypothetical protein